MQALLDRPSLTEQRRKELEEEIYCPELPKELAYLWQAFLRLNKRRGSNGFGYNPISWYEMDAFVRLSSMKFAPWEISLLEDIDELWLAEQNKERT